jgi:transcriptional regulator with XRE-family HTH domain
MTDGLLGSQAEFVALWRAAMTAQGLTHREVDDRAGLGEGYVSKLMCGQRAPTPRTIERMNRALGIRLRPEMEAEVLTP